MTAPQIRPRRRTGGARWALLKLFEVPDATEPNLVYLRRLRAVQTPWFGIYLHWIYLPDRDRDPHDHPWPFVSWVLRGGYTETVYTDRDTCAGYERSRWSAHRVGTEVAHSIDTLRPRTVTLVLVGRRCREWGFWTAKGWVHWRSYDRSGNGPDPFGGPDEAERVTFRAVEEQDGETW
jgi:hypothetical protein